MGRDLGDGCKDLEFTLIYSRGRREKGYNDAVKTDLGHVGINVNPGPQWV